jgi:hypothetical protein
VSINHTGPFGKLTAHLTGYSEQLAEKLWDKAPLFEDAGAAGIRYLCASLTTVLYVPLNVTPALAAVFLELESPDNRAPNPQTQDAYARDMADEQWLETGDGIRFDASGVMQDGGHRCRAIVQSGVTVRTLVVFGIDPVAVHDIDSGRMRTLANYLKFLGEKDISVLRSVIPHLIAWDEGIVIKPARSAKRTRHEVLQYIEDHPEVRDFVTEGRRVARQVIGLAPSAATLAMVLLARTGLPQEAAQFLEELETGLTTRTAVTHLRARLLKGVRRTTGRSRGSLTMEEQLAFIVVAWNRRDEEVRELRVPGVLSDRNFPRPRELEGRNGEAA